MLSNDERRSVPIYLVCTELFCKDYCKEILIAEIYILSPTSFDCFEKESNRHRYCSNKLHWSYIGYSGDGQILVQPPIYLQECQHY